MRTFLFIALAAICCYSALAAVQKSTTATCTTAQNPWGTRCTNANCVPYVDSAAASTPLGAFACNTAATGYTIFSGLNIDASGKTASDSVCINNCAAGATGDTTAPCDTTGLLCSTCATNYAASGKTPSATSQQPCDCIVASDKTQTCPACAHGYYGVSTANAAITPSSVSGSTDATYALQYSGTLPAKCVVCPTLSNCAQCASATVCAKCTTASGNTPTSSGSCSATKVFASVAVVFVGLVALLF